MIEVLLALGGVGFVAFFCKFMQAVVLPAARVRRRQIAAWWSRDYLPEIESYCGHPEPELVPVYSNVFRPNELVATLCVVCDGQLGPEVWQKKMDRELAELDAPKRDQVYVPVMPQLRELDPKKIEERIDTAEADLARIQDSVDQVAAELERKTRKPTGEKTMAQVLRGWRGEVTPWSPDAFRMREIILKKDKWYARMPISDEIAGDEFAIIRAVDRFLNVLEDEHPEMFEDQKPANEFESTMLTAMNAGFLAGPITRQPRLTAPYADRVEFGSHPLKRAKRTF